MICVVAIPFRGNVQILIKRQGVSSPCMSMGIGYCYNIQSCYSCYANV